MHVLYPMVTSMMGWAAGVRSVLARDGDGGAGVRGQGAGLDTGAPSTRGASNDFRMFQK